MVTYPRGWYYNLCMRLENAKVANEVFASLNQKVIRYERLFKYGYYSEALEQGWEIIEGFKILQEEAEMRVVLVEDKK